MDKAPSRIAEVMVARILGDFHAREQMAAVEDVPNALHITEVEGSPDQSADALEMFGFIALPVEFGQELLFLDFTM